MLVGIGRGCFGRVHVGQSLLVDNDWGGVFRSVCWSELVGGCFGRVNVDHYW